MSQACSLKFNSYRSSAVGLILSVDMIFDLNSALKSMLSNCVKTSINISKSKQVIINDIDRPSKDIANANEMSPLREIIHDFIKVK